MLSFYLNNGSVDTLLINRLLYIWDERLFSKVQIKRGDYPTSFMQASEKQQPGSVEKEFATYTGIAEILGFFKRKIPPEERILQPVKIGGRVVTVPKHNVFGITKVNAPMLLPLYGQKAIIDLLRICVAKRGVLDEQDLFYFFSQTKPIMETFEIIFTKKFGDILTKSGNTHLEQKMVVEQGEIIKDSIPWFKALCTYGIPSLHDVLQKGYITHAKPFVSRRATSH
jgi:hypothetical protein